jgi:hypothetical protein
MHSLKRRILLLVVALAAVPVFAADLVSVSTHVSYPTAYPGGANQGEVLINNTTNADVRVRLDVQVVYSNGTVQRLTGIPDPGVLPPGGGFFQSVYFIIPTDAPPGTATFVADVAASSGGLQEKETSAATCEIVIP